MPARRDHLDFEYESKYELAMERVTATLDARTLAEIRRVAGRRGVSRFIQVAARERLERLRLLRWIDDLDAEYGPPSEKARAQVEADARRLFRR
jgi:hypothetical protein